MKSHSAEREGISKLPAPILQHILSFLSQKNAVKTCVLSKSWRHLGSTRPNFILKESQISGGEEKFMDVLKKSIQVYSDQKLRIEDFSVSFMSTVDSELESLLEEWIPIVIHELGVKKFHLSFCENGVNFDVPSVVFESESLEEINLERCNLSQIQINNSIGTNHHLKTLILQEVGIEDDTFSKFLSSCSSIEDLSLRYCKGLTTINMPNHHNLKRFEIDLVHDGSIDIYCSSYFPSLTCLRLSKVPLSNEWFNRFSRDDFPCLEELQLWKCNGFDELKLSSRSIKNLDIWMDKSTIKATIIAPSIKKFHFQANISQSISFTTTSSSEWNSNIRLSLDQLDASQWFLKLSELVTALSQSQINSLVLYHSCSENHEHIEHLPVLCCGRSYKMRPVAIERLEFDLRGLYYDSFFSDLMNGLVFIIRPREINNRWFVDPQHDDHRKKNEVVEFLCRTLQLGRRKDEEMSLWQQFLEEVSLEVNNGTEWHPVQGTISWSEYVAALLPLKYSFCKLRFRLKWRE